tara:strand:+ start:523 stop:1296 length:774 start_codon:yes stop_codon:yes gene_type:complete
MNNNKYRNPEIDARQSDEYYFPYHYIPSVSSFPMFSKTWTFSPSYIAAIKLAGKWLENIKINNKKDHLHMDYGCGDGGFLNTIAKNYNIKNMKFEGIDTDKRAVDWANQFSDGINFECNDLKNLENNKYDSGSLVEVIEHIPPSEVDAFILALSQSMKSGGQLFVTAPSTEKPLEKKHYRHFDFDMLIACFSKYFDVNDCFGFERIDFFGKFCMKLMMRKNYFIETKVTSNYFINSYTKKHQKLDGCGRIGLVLTKK